MKNKYKKFYFSGFSWGALIGLIVSTQIKFEKTFLFSTALFAENRGSQKKFLAAWKKLGTLPDWKAFQKGKIKPAKDKLSYKFVNELKKYKIKQVCKKVKSETILVCGNKELPTKKQDLQIFKLLKVNKKRFVINSVGHNSSNKIYQNNVVKILNENLN